ncbi:putative quinol monooxygenase [Desulfonatronum thioautotrophicum]|uniref:putative quinol monooxygenase n=1 Tax=Desulfonatronum thioautotrophicum TaxID=617001 RepID=UPI00069C409D|nr:antibiotic biosynthesis monooxygenase family protein [Desulfonatronum thioautotrophicum]
MFMNFIKLQAMAEKRKEVEQTLTSLASLIQSEPGCLASNLYQRVGDETVFLLISAWQTREALDDHLQSSRLSVLVGARCLLSQSPEMAIHTVAPSTGLKALNPEQLQAVR